MLSCNNLIIHKIGDNLCMEKHNMIENTYDLVTFFFTILKDRSSKFYNDRNAIMRNLEKVHLLLCPLNSKFDNKDLIFMDYILIGWSLIEEYNNHVRIYMFEMFIEEEVSLNKISKDKVYFVCNPIDFEYWIKLGAFDNLFDNWYNTFEDIPNNYSDIMRTFKNFLLYELLWSEISFQQYLKYMYL